MIKRTLTRNDILKRTEHIIPDSSLTVSQRSKIIKNELPNIESFLAEKRKVHAKKIEREHPDWMNLCYHEPLLTKEQEQFLFKKYNILKERARRYALQAHISRSKRILEQADKVRDQLILSNMRLVVSSIKKEDKNNYDDFMAQSIAWLIVAIDRFDYKLGYKFSTYSYWVLKRNLMEYKKRNYRQRGILFTETTINIEEKPEHVSDGITLKEYKEIKDYSEELLSVLSERERMIIEYRYGFGANNPMTLKEVSDKLNVSRERIRQLQARATRKMKLYASINSMNLD